MEWMWFVELCFAPKGRKGLVEKSSLIRHSVSAQKRVELSKMAQSLEQRSSSSTENQAFLKDVSGTSLLSKIRSFHIYS